MYREFISTNQYGDEIEKWSESIIVLNKNKDGYENKYKNTYRFNEDRIYGGLNKIKSHISKKYSKKLIWSDFKEILKY